MRTACDITHGLLDMAKRKHGQEIRPCKSCWAVSFHVYHRASGPMCMLYFNTPDHSTHAVSMDVTEEEARAIKIQLDILEGSAK